MSDSRVVVRDQGGAPFVLERRVLEPTEGEPARQYLRGGPYAVDEFGDRILVGYPTYAWDEYHANLTNHYDKAASALADARTVERRGLAEGHWIVVRSGEDVRQELEGDEGRRVHAENRRTSLVTNYKRLAETLDPEVGQTILEEIGRAHLAAKGTDLSQPFDDWTLLEPSGNETVEDVPGAHSKSWGL